MPAVLFARCPCCGIEAKNDINMIENVFGFRTMTESGRKIPQSYCHKCRSKRCGKNKKNCQ